jgi:hypothetical protein
MENLAEHFKRALLLQEKTISLNSKKIRGALQPPPF